MSSFRFPVWWAAFLDAHGLHGARFELDERADASGYGANLQFLSEAQAREEAEDCYPGLAMAADGYVPVGMCLLGSGDPYFVRRGDGPGGALYRIRHDALFRGDDGVLRPGADAVEQVLASYETLLAHRLA